MAVILQPFILVLGIKPNRLYLARAVTWFDFSGISSTSSFCGTCTLTWRRNSTFLCTAEFIGFNALASNWKKKIADKFVNFNLWIPKAHRSLTRRTSTNFSVHYEQVFAKPESCDAEKVNETPKNRNTWSFSVINYDYWSKTRRPVTELILCYPMIQCAYNVLRLQLLIGWWDRKSVV